MSLVSPLRVVNEQFRPQSHLRSVEFAWLIPPSLVAALAWRQDVHLANAALLLTATSILTGLTFTMTTTFWGKSIEARRDPRRALEGAILTILDRNLFHLLWTVMVGVASTGTLAMTAIFVSPTAGAPVWLTMACAWLLTYLVTLVGIALHRFTEAALLLR